MYIKWLKARFNINGAHEFWIRQAISGYAKDEVVRADLNKTILKNKGLDINKLEKKFDDILENTTKEELQEWIKKNRL